MLKIVMAKKREKVPTFCGLKTTIGYGPRTSLIMEQWLQKIGSPTKREEVAPAPLYHHHYHPYDHYSDHDFTIMIAIHMKIIVIMIIIFTLASKSL